MAKVAKEAFETIKKALAAGEFGAAAKVAMAAIKLAFAEGLNWLRKKWIDTKEFLSNTWIALSSQVESIWSSLTTAMVKMLTATASKSFGLLADIAERLGMSQKAMELRMMGSGIGAVGAVQGNGEQGAIAKRQREAEDMNAQMAEEQRQAIGDTAKEQDELAKAMEEARRVTEEANAIAAEKAQQEAKAEEKSATATLATSVRSEAQTAINSAAVVNSVEGQNAYLRGIQGFGRITDGEKMLGDKLDAAVAAINEMAENAVVLSEGPII